MGRHKKLGIVNVLHNFPGTKTEKMLQLSQQWHGCTRCDLCQFRLKDSGETDPAVVFGEGDADSARVLIVGEAPGVEEESTKVPFVGAAGRLLNQMLAYTTDNESIKQLGQWYEKLPKREFDRATPHFHEQVHLWRRTEFFVTNVVACRPPENRTPTYVEVKQCWERLYNIIYILDPLVIIAVGKTAIESLMGKVMEITKVRGQYHELTLPGRLVPISYPVIPVLHPSFLLRKADWNTDGGDYRKTLKDLLQALHILDQQRANNYGTPIPSTRPEAK